MGVIGYVGPQDGWDVSFNEDGATAQARTDRRAWLVPWAGAVLVMVKAEGLAQDGRPIVAALSSGDAMSLRYFSFLAVLVFAAAGFSPARADDLYTVSGMHVDAVGASSTEATNTAILQGRPKAFQILYRRLTRQQDWGREPPLDGAGLVRLSRGYSVANERRSTTRYVADVTYMFSPDSVARLLRSLNIAYSATAAKRILVVAMSPGVTHGPWAQALSAPGPCTIPWCLSEVADGGGRQVAGRSQFRHRQLERCRGRRRAHQGERSGAGAGGLCQRQGDGEYPPPGPGRDAGQDQRRCSIAADGEHHLSRRRPGCDSRYRGYVEVAYRGRFQPARPAHRRCACSTSLAQLGAIQTALGAVDTITSVQVVAMDIGYARLSLAYIGTPDQLRESLGAAGIGLTNRGVQWTIVLASGQ